MRKIIILLMFVILFSSFTSAEIIITQQPDPLYNIGDIIDLPLKIVASTDVVDSFKMQLICNGIETEVLTKDIILNSGEEELIAAKIILTQERTKRTTGTCKIKLGLGENYVLTNDFTISNLINLELKERQVEFAPGEAITIEGNAKKENKEFAEGFIDVKITGQDLSEPIEILDTVNLGYFFINFSLPKETKAGEYLVSLNVYEKNSEGEVTNNGETDFNILISQIPTSLEIVFDPVEVSSDENQGIEPGTDLKVKAVLHDQTGEKIKSMAVITIKDENNIILQQTEKQTDEFLEFPISYNQPPEEWTVFAVSNKLTSEMNFKIKEKEDVRIDLTNKTITISNTGNVFYNKSVLVKIGDSSVNIDVNLKVDESQKYSLSAPDGEYQVEIITDEGNKFTGMATLTGKAINVKKASEGVLTLARHPLVWIFIIAILGFIAFTIFKKGYKRSFFGYISPKRKNKNKQIPLKKNSLINAKNKSEISLSIKGDKQNVSAVCLKIKNLKEIESQKSNAEKTLQKVVDFAEEKKGFVYENQENLFFILAPIKTRTFSNEQTAVKIAQKIKEILAEHNRLFKQKIEFGISLNYGTIIAKQEKDILKFMSIGTLITTAKRIASVSVREILLSEKINDKLKSYVKSEKQNKQGTIFYTIKEIKDTEGNKRFIRNFLDRIEKKS